SLAVGADRLAGCRTIGLAFEPTKQFEPRNGLLSWILIGSVTIGAPEPSPAPRSKSDGSPAGRTVAVTAFSGLFSSWSQMPDTNEATVVVPVAAGIAGLSTGQRFSGAQLPRRVGAAAVIPSSSAAAGAANASVLSARVTISALEYLIRVTVRLTPNISFQLPV